MRVVSPELLGGGVGTFPERSIIEFDLKFPRDCALLSLRPQNASGA